MMRRYYKHGSDDVSGLEVMNVEVEWINIKTAVVAIIICLMSKYRLHNSSARFIPLRESPPSYIGGVKLNSDESQINLNVHANRESSEKNTLPLFKSYQRAGNPSTARARGSSPQQQPQCALFI